MPLRLSVEERVTNDISEHASPYTRTGSMEMHECMSIALMFVHGVQELKIGQLRLIVSYV